MIGVLRQLLAVVLSVTLGLPSYGSVAGVTTKYLVDTQNPTGYAQVVYETYSGSTAANRELNHTFVYELERISQLRNFLANKSFSTQTSYYWVRQRAHRAVAVP